MPIFNSGPERGEGAPAGTSVPRQLSLFGTSRAADVESRDNVFFALLPDEQVQLRIGRCGAEMKRAHSLSGRLTDPGRLHVSLHALNVYPRPISELIAMGRRLGDRIQASPFEVTFDHILCFNGQKAFRTPGMKQAIVLADGREFSALKAFHALLGGAMREVGLGRRLRWNFTPHITLLWDEHDIPRQDIAPITWTVREFVLVRSLVGQSRHIHLGRWPLRS